MGSGHFYRIFGIFAGLAVVFLIIMTGADRNLQLTGNGRLRVGVFSDSCWGVRNGYPYQIVEDAIARFKDKNPEVKVTFESGVIRDDYSEWLAEKVVSGTAPDVFFVLLDDRNTLARIGALEPLNPFASEDPELDPSAYYDAAYQAGMIGDTLYTLPSECASKLMFVNKSLLDREGIEMPGEDWTWDDFLGICRKVTKDNNGNGALDQFGFSGYTWKDAADSNGVRLFNDEGTACYFNSPEMEEVLLFFEELSETQAGIRETEPKFEEGNVAFAPMLFPEYRSYKSDALSIIKYSDFEWDCAPMPAGPSGVTLSVLETLSVGMNAASTQKPLAWELIRTMVSDPEIQSEIYEYSDGISPLRAVTESEETASRLRSQSGGDVNPQVMKYVMEHAGIEPHFPGYQAAIEEAGRSVGAVLGESASIQMGQVIENRRLNLYLQGMSG